MCQMYQWWQIIAIATKISQIQIAIINGGSDRDEFSEEQSNWGSYTGPREGYPSTENLPTLLGQNRKLSILDLDTIYEECLLRTLTNDSKSTMRLGSYISSNSSICGPLINTSNQPSQIDRS